MASRIPRAAADAEGRQVLELLVNSWMLALHKPSTANNRYRGLQQWFRWMASEDEIDYSPSPS